MEKIICFNTKYGWINIIEINNQVTSVLFGKIGEKNPSSQLKKFKKNILNYFSGKKIIFNDSLQIIGSKLQKKILNEIKKIPYGETRSYGHIAKLTNTSPRYVGNVCGQNKHLLIIPCHRVVRSDGSLGGFSGLGGIKLKKNLIDLENNV